MNVSYIDGASGDSFPKDQDFDTVVCLNVVEHLPDDVGALRNIRDALADGGTRDHPGSVRSETLSAAWMKCWDIAAVIPRSNSVAPRNKPDFKWRRF